MGKKRDFAEAGSGSPEPAQESRGRGAFNDAGPSKKRKYNTKTKHRPNEGTSEWAKKRTRTIERLLKRNQDLPADVHNNLERELAALRATVSDKAFQKKRSAMISKYHMVRFFERKKAIRLAKQLRKKIDQTESPEDIEELKRDLHVAEVDEAYTQHFPHAEPYISLYTSGKTEKEADDEKNDYTPLKHRGLLHTERPPIWSDIEQAMKEGPNALRSLRERRSTDGSQERSQPERKQSKPKAAINTGKPAPKTQQRQEAVKGKGAPSNNKGESGVKMNRRERRRQMHQGIQPAVKDEDGEDDSDGGGFFEEG
ncbi:hypothetical protein FDECE_18068 [Fusarium decemcellulare]|nr:hypothetical protein FDECE_18068 [Fusarium decemcellulare]